MSERYFVCNTLTGKVMFEGNGDYTLIDFSEFGPNVTARPVQVAHPFDHYTYDSEADDFVYVGPPDPNNEPADWPQIKHWRDSHEVAPIATSFGTFDCDPRSDARMEGAIDRFVLLPTLNAQGQLAWKRADNSFIWLSQADLTAVYEEVKTNRAARGALLHVKAETFRQMATPPTPAQLADLSFWLEE